MTFGRQRFLRQPRGFGISPGLKLSRHSNTVLCAHLPGDPSTDLGDVGIRINGPLLDQKHPQLSIHGNTTDIECMHQDERRNVGHHSIKRLDVFTSLPLLHVMQRIHRGFMFPEEDRMKGGTKTPGTFLLAYVAETGHVYDLIDLADTKVVPVNKPAPKISACLQRTFRRRFP